MSIAKKKQTESDLIRVSNLCAYIDANIHRDLNFLELVEFSGMTYQDLVQAFNAHKNTTPMQYVRMKREKRTIKNH